MAKKPIRVFKSTSWKIETSQRSGTHKAVAVYKDGSDKDRRSITQQVIKHPKAREARAGEISQSKYDELFHSIYDAVVTTDLNGDILEVNARAEQSFIWSKEDLKKMNIVNLISGADDQLLKILAKNVDDKKYTVLEAICVRGDETRFPVEIVVNRLRGHEKSVLYFFIRDESLRKDAEEELMLANEKLIEGEKLQARLDTLSTLFYELNNPLQILTCMAELDKNKEYKKQLNRIVAVLDQLREQGSLERVLDDVGGTRYEIAGTKELGECDSSKILVVDDEKMLRKMFVTALKAKFPDMEIDSAGDGRKARDLFNEDHHAFIMMDSSMPVMNGEEAFMEIKAICERDSLRLPHFIFCTGFVIGDTLQEIIGDGSYHTCLKKPLTIDELAKTVQRLISE